MPWKKYIYIFTLTRIYTIWLNVAIILALLSNVHRHNLPCISHKNSYFPANFLFLLPNTISSSMKDEKKNGNLPFLLLVILAISLSFLCTQSSFWLCWGLLFFCLFKKFFFAASAADLNFSWNCKCLLFGKLQGKLSFFCYCTSRGLKIHFSFLLLLVDGESWIIFFFYQYLQVAASHITFRYDEIQ